MNDDSKKNLNELFLIASQIYHHLTKITCVDRET